LRQETVLPSPKFRLTETSAPATTDC